MYQAEYIQEIQNTRYLILGSEDVLADFTEGYGDESEVEEDPQQYLDEDWEFEAYERAYAEA